MSHGFGGVEVSTMQRIREFLRAENLGLEEFVIQDEAAPPKKRRSRRKDPEKKPYGALASHEKDAWERLNRAAAKRRCRANWDPQDPVYAYLEWCRAENRRDRIAAIIEGRPPPLVQEHRYVRHVAVVLTSGDGRLLIRNPYSLKKRNRRSKSREDAWEGLFRTRLLSFEDPDAVAAERIHSVLSGASWEWTGSASGIVSPEAGIEYSFVFGRCAAVEPSWGWRWRRPDDVELAPDQLSALERATRILPGGVLTPAFWRATIAG